MAPERTGSVSPPEPDRAGVRRTPARMAGRYGWADRAHLLASRPLWFAAALVAVTAIFQLSGIGSRTGVPVYRPGEMAVAEFRTPFALTLEDPEATQEQRDKARRAVPPVYESSLRPLQETAGGIRTSWEKRAARRLPVSIGALEEALGPVLQERIVADRLPIITAQRAILRDRRRSEEWEEPVDHIRELAQARAAARAAVLALPGLTASDAELLADVVDQELRPNLTPDTAETEKRRRLAAAQVVPSVVSYPAGAVILRPGETVSPLVARALDRILAMRARESHIRRLLGAAGITAVFLLLLWLYLDAARPARAAPSADRTYGVAAAALILSVAGCAVTLLIADALFGVLHGVARVHSHSFYYAVPFAGGAMALALLLEVPVASLFAAVLAALLGYYGNGSYAVSLFALLSGLGSIFLVRRFRRRADVFPTGIKVGVWNAGVVAVIQAIGPWIGQGEWSTWDWALGIAGGALSAVFFLLLLTVLERVFDLLTDLRLQELAAADNPLLRELAQEAPGTYSHSVTVGHLAETAAEAIGANPFFCRVAAYYHDVGKTRMPEYYIENVRDGVNRHDRLSPSMSALIIASHVKDGIEMARAAGVPEAIVDIIPQHHGTRTMHYFYEKAKRHTDPEVHEVREDEFRYPGPKPQTREAAIFMLADAAEAAARSIENPTPAKLQGMLRQVSSAIIMDGQLDECDLTFRDVEAIQQAFLHTFLHMHHGRISYPGYDFEGEAREEGSRAAGRPDLPGEPRS